MSSPTPITKRSLSSTDTEKPPYDLKLKDEEHDNINEDSQKPDADTEADADADADELTYPEGGSRAWLVAAGAASITFSTMGYGNSFGIFQSYYMLHQLQDHTADDIAWIGGTQAFLMMAMGAFAGPMFDRFGVWMIRPACIVYVFSVMMTSLCKEYWQFMLAQGILTGLAMGFVIFPSMAAVMQYFNKRRGAAMGSVLAGSSIGAVVFPTVLSNLLNETDVGFGWSVRACGFIMLPTLLFSCITVRTRLEPRASRFFLWEAFRNPLYIILIVAGFLLFSGMFIPLFFIPSYAVSRGMDEALASYLVAMVNGASIFGRIIPGIMADKLGRINMFGGAGFLTSICIFCWTRATSNAGIIVFAIAVGFVSGALLSGSSVVFSLCPKDPKEIGTYMGMGMAIASLSALVSPPANGALLSAYGRFDEVTWLSGSMCMAGALLLVVAKTQTPQGVFGRV